MVFKYIALVFLLLSCFGSNEGYKFGALRSNPGIGGSGNGGGTGQIDGCLHDEAANFSSSTDPAQENCLFEICTDPLKTGYDVNKLLAYQEYLKNTKGFILDKDSLCGANNADGNSTVNFPNGYGNYHTYQEFTEKIKDYHARFPDTSQIITIGKSVQNRPIMGMRISNAINMSDTESSNSLPAFVIFGTHHAREHLSTEVPLLMIEFLLDRINNNPAFSELMKTREVYIFPLINPDGALHDIRNGSFDLWRKNVRDLPNTNNIGVDLNRNYSFGFGGPGASANTASDTYHGPSAFSEPETQAIKKFVESNSTRIKTMITFHSFSELILYPWGGSTDQVPAPDLDVFVKMSGDMGAMTGYRPMQASELYVASGDTCDWAYGDHKIFCVTFELTPAQSNGGTSGFYPADTVIQRVFTANQAPVLYMIDMTDDPYKVIQ